MVTPGDSRKCEEYLEAPFNHNAWMVKETGVLAQT
jgi:hypothetical protein